MTEELSSRDYYFDSYSHFGIHEEMLKDEVRTVAYRDAIMRNKHLFQDKVVLDIGCGTGILCMFAAQAGARLVIGVDMSGIIEQARKIVVANGFGEDRIVLLRGKMEEVKLPVEKVDIIISEWMGYFLLYESMLDTVIWARDQYLAPGGFILPDRATLQILAIEDAQYKEEKIHYWDDVYGFDMSCIKEWALREPLVDTVPPTSILSSPATICDIDIMKVRREDLTFTTPFTVRLDRSEGVHALVGYFTIDFFSFTDANKNMAGKVKKIHFGTGPADRYTHWKQTVFYLPHDLQANKGDSVVGELSCRPNGKNPRDLDITISYEHHNSQGQVLLSRQTQEYHMC